METFVIHTENPSQTQAVKEALKALNIELEDFPVEAQSSLEILPSHISTLLHKGLAEANNKDFTAHEDFMEQVKSKYQK